MNRALAGRAPAVPRATAARPPGSWEWAASRRRLSSKAPASINAASPLFEDSNSGRIFEASNVCKLEGTDKFLAIVEAFDQTSSNHRYFRSWVARSLEGPWLPWQASGTYPFAGPRNTTFEGTEWTLDISHGEMIRAGYDETLTVSPCNMRYIFQGADPLADNEGDYNKIRGNWGF